MKSPLDTIQDQIEAERLLESILRRLNARVLGLTLGLVFAIGIFVATNVLVWQGGPNVGAHLSLLRYYLPFYEVTLLGSFIGAVWAFAYGFFAGIVISRLYNLVAGLRKD